MRKQFTYLFDNQPAIECGKWFMHNGVVFMTDISEG